MNEKTPSPHMQKMEKGKASYAKDLQSQIQTHAEKNHRGRNGMEKKWKKIGRPELKKIKINKHGMNNNMSRT